LPNSVHTNKRALACGLSRVFSTYKLVGLFCGPKPHKTEKNSRRTLRKGREALTHRSSSVVFLWLFLSNSSNKVQDYKALNCYIKNLNILLSEAPPWNASCDSLRFTAYAYPVRGGAYTQRRRARPCKWIEVDMDTWVHVSIQTLPYCPIGFAVNP
jgi:hypothetical protein